MSVDDGEGRLRDVALRAWKLIDESGGWTPVASLCGEFEVDAETCLRDIEALLSDLSAVGLTEVAP